MAAFLDRTRLKIEPSGTKVTVPDSPRAKLMYYLNSVLSLASDTSSLSSDVRKLRDYENYYLLDDDEVETLIALCVLFSPDELIGKLIFVEPAMCPDANNEFYKITAVSHKLLVSSSVMIGGQRQRVTEIMACEPSWLEKNWATPMRTLMPWYERRRRRARARESSSCVVQ